MTVVAAAQVIKTRTALNALGWMIDCDPGPIMLVMSSKEQADDVVEQRVRPFLERTPTLAARRSHSKAHWKTDELWFDRCILRIAGSNSASQLSSHSIRWLILDEVDKFRGQTEKHGSSVALAEARTKAWGTLAKTLAFSTPTTKFGAIWRRFLAGTQERYWVPCPHCGEFQILKFEQIRVATSAGTSPAARGSGARASGVASATTIGSVATSTTNPEVAFEQAHYECVVCRGKILDHHKTEMLDRGQWRALVTGRRHRSFHIGGLYSPVLGFGYFARRFMLCHPLDESGNVIARSKPYPDALQAFQNEDLGELWEEPGEAATDEQILSHRDESYGPGECPTSSPFEVILYADVQHSGCYYVIRAYGPHETSYLLDYGFTLSCEELQPIGQNQYRTPGDGLVSVTRVALDSSDGTQVDHIYEVCRRFKWTAVKNYDISQQPQPVRLGKGPAGVRLILVQTPYFKDYLMRKLQIHLGDPGAFHLHRETGLDYVRHMTCEKRVDDVDQFGAPRVSWVQSHPDNHWFDCEVGQLAIAYVLRLRYRHLPEDTARRRQERNTRDDLHNRTARRRERIDRMRDRVGARLRRRNRR